MTEIGTTTDGLLRRAKAGDTAALGALFAHYRDRLRQMVRLRLRLRSLCSCSRPFPFSYLASPLWLRSRGHPLDRSPAALPCLLSPTP